MTVLRGESEQKFTPQTRELRTLRKTDCTDFGNLPIIVSAEDRNDPEKKIFVNGKIIATYESEVNENTRKRLQIIRSKDGNYYLYDDGRRSEKKTSNGEEEWLQMPPERMTLEEIDFVE